MGEIPNLMINLPPQHGKTEMVRVGTSWNFGKNPDDRVMFAAFNYNLATKSNRYIQRIMISPEYYSIFPNTRLNDRNIRMDIKENYLKNSDEFEIVGREGCFKSVGILGEITGNPVDKFIMDDLIKGRMAAESEVIRNNIWDAYVNEVNTRLHNDSQKMFISTRWHWDDPAGRIIKLLKDNAISEEWDIVTLPAIKNDKSSEPEDLRVDGEALWESQHSLQKHLDVKRMDSYTFQCLYQQDPKPREGLLYGKFKTYSKCPNGVIHNITDPADSGECYTCSISYIIFMNKVYLIDIVYNQSQDMENEVAKLLYRNKTSVSRIERNSIGRLFAKNVEKELTEKLRCFRTVIKTYVQTKNKDAKIFTSAHWITENVIMPEDWAVRWYKFNEHITNYPSNGKTKYKDGADVLAEIYFRSNKNDNYIQYGGD
jgi:predicted phage terminase large subunit-like protein